MTEVGLGLFNAAPADRLHNMLRDCCAAEAWISAVAGGRPYLDWDSVVQVSDEATEGLDEVGVAEALAVHPRIGERAEEAWSAHEQSGMAGADAALRAQLDEANWRYEARFGQIYLVNATGRSARELWELCLSRLTHSQVVEQVVVRRELAAINRLRLGKLFKTEQ